MKANLKVFHLIKGLVNPAEFEIYANTYTANETAFSFETIDGETVGFLNHAVQAVFTGKTYDEA